MKDWRFAIVLALVGMSGSGYAEIYKWVDEQGRVHYGDKPHAQAEAAVKRDCGS